MSGYSWLELVFFFVLLAVSTPLLGNYMALVYSNGKAPGDRVFLPVERFVYKVCRIDPKSEQTSPRRTPPGPRCSRPCHTTCAPR